MSAHTGRVEFGHATSQNDLQIFDSEPRNLKATQAQASLSPLPSPSPTPVASVSELSKGSGTVASTTIIISNPPGLLQSPKPTNNTRDLWSDALQKLSDRDQHAIQLIQPTTATQLPLSERMEGLIRLAKTKQYECEEKHYRFRWRGKEVILRDVVEKIVIWLNKFKDIGDIVVNFDPAHASLPWAGVRFLLQVLRNASQEEIFTKTHPR